MNGIAPVVRGVGEVAAGAVQHVAAHGTDALVARTSAARSASAGIRDAHDGALMVRILAPETDGDGLAMVDALRRRGADAAIWSFEELDVPASGALRYRGASVEPPDVVVPYDPHMPGDAIAKLRALEQRGIASLNSADSVEASLSKTTTAALLRAAGLPHPETIVVRHPSDVRAAVEALARPGTPVFLKNPVGTQGVGVAGLRDPEEAVAVGELVTSVPGGRELLVQAGIAMPDGVPRHDSRLFVVNGRVVAAMDRVQHDPSKLLTGLHSNGTGVPRAASDSERATAVAAAREVGLEGVAGVDMMGGKVLEVNHGPGHKIGRVTGVDVTGAVVDAALVRARAARTRTS